MTLTITSDSDIEEIRKRLGVGEDEDLRSSTRRELHLQKFARLMAANPNIDLRIGPYNPHVDLKGDRPIIRIQDEALPQPATEYPQNIYDLMTQETVTLHEVGHILFSDWPTVERHVIERFSDGNEQAVAKYLWNIIEDGVIESELMRVFICRREFEVLHRNLSEPLDGEPKFGRFGRRPDGNGDAHLFTVVEAVVTALFDLGYYDSGTLDDILDPNQPDVGLVSEKDQEAFEDFLPEIVSVIEDARKLADAKKRNLRIGDFCEEAMRLFDGSDFPGMYDHSKSENHAPVEGMPDDASSGIGSAQEETGETQRAAEAGETKVRVPDPEAESEEEQPGSGEQDGPGEEDDESGGGSGEDDEETDYDEGLARDYAEELQNEAESVLDGESMLEEAEAYKRALSRSGGPGTGSEKLHFPDPRDGNEETWAEGEALAQVLEPIFENRLRAKRRDRWTQNRSRGMLRPTSTTMLKGAQRDLRIFSSLRRGDTKDYHAILVVDRSGSMSGDIDEVEVSTIGVAGALDAVGVKTEVLTIHEGQIWLSKPFGGSIRSAMGQLSYGEAKGGTPLRVAVRLARLRLDEIAAGNRFLFVITDGQAHQTEKYHRELRMCRFPVLGLYVNQSLSRGDGNYQTTADEMDAFHYWSILTKDDRVTPLVSGMIEKLLL